MRVGDLVRNKHTQSIGLIISKSQWTLDGYGYGEAIRCYDFEVLLCEKDESIMVSYEMLEEHWEIIYED